jgi:hypothetical protein
MLLMVRWLMASPVPSTKAGGLRSDLARSAEVTTSAPPPSVTRQQSRTVSGWLTMRAARTSCTVSGSCSHAFGFFNAHWRAATAISASCSRVVPNSWKWRDAASAYALACSTGLKGVSYGLNSRGATFLRPAVRCVLP